MSPGGLMSIVRKILDLRSARADDSPRRLASAEGWC